MADNEIWMRRTKIEWEERNHPNRCNGSYHQKLLRNSGDACFKTVSDFAEPSMTGSLTETLKINKRQFSFVFPFLSKNQIFKLFVERHRLPLVSYPNYTFPYLNPWSFPWPLAPWWPLDCKENKNRQTDFQMKLVLTVWCPMYSRQISQEPNLSDRFVSTRTAIQKTNTNSIKTQYISKGHNVYCTVIGNVKGSSIN